MAFADVSDLLARYDARLVGDLSTDAGETQASADVLVNPQVVAALEDASGEIVVALQSGGRYTVEQLEDLAGYNAQHLKRVCCDIAMHLLIKRRPMMADDQAESISKQSREHLNRLAKGENVFGIAEHVEAGNLDLATASTMQIESRNLMTERMSRYFPGTSQRMPRGQQ